MSISSYTYSEFHFTVVPQAHFTTCATLVFFQRLSSTLYDIIMYHCASGKLAKMCKDYSFQSSGIEDIGELIWDIHVETCDLIFHQQHNCYQNL